jgi:hypothetical protein
MTIYIGVSVTFTNLDITSGLPERDPPMPCALQTTMVETPTLKEIFVKLTGVAPTKNLCFRHQYFI